MPDVQEQLRSRFGTLVQGERETGREFVNRIASEYFTGRVVYSVKLGSVRPDKLPGGPVRFLPLPDYGIALYYYVDEAKKDD
jgi:hypothetical protein